MKRTKRSKRAVELDRISSLPDSLVSDILSRLNSTKHSIKTGTLSKRWKRVWFHLPNVIFNHDDYDHDDKGNSKFVSDLYSSIENILNGYDESKLIKFQLHGPFDFENDDLESCIRHTIDLKVQEFDIDVWDYFSHVGFSLPDFFFRCSSFVNLRLSECSFKYLDVVCWKNLKILSIADSSFDEDIFQKILSGTPLLEELILECCNSFKILDISNKSVRSFVIHGCVSMFIDNLQINAPYIQSLSIKGDFALEKFLLLNISSLIKAELDYSNNTIFYYNEEAHEGDPINEEFLKGLISSLSNVKEVKVGKSCMKVLGTLKAKGFIYPSNLKVEEFHSN